MEEHAIEYEKLNLEGEDVHLHIHRANSSAVLIMYPGADGNIDGYNQKYLKIANLIQSKNIATVVRLDNKYLCLPQLPYCEAMINKLAYAIEYIHDNAERISGRKEIDIYLAGVSAGASAVATILQEFPHVKKVLFIAPASSVGWENIKRGLRGYTGEVYLTAGQNDEIEAFDIARVYHDTCEVAIKKEIEIIPECDHQFRGKENGQILSNAYLWAFSEENNFPSSDGGIVLYE
jgi:hypothetical protein